MAQLGGGQCVSPGDVSGAVCWGDGSIREGSPGGLGQGKPLHSGQDSGFREEIPNLNLLRSQRHTPPLPSVPVTGPGRAHRIPGSLVCTWLHVLSSMAFCVRCRWRTAHQALPGIAFLSLNFQTRQLCCVLVHSLLSDSVTP